MFEKILYKRCTCSFCGIKFSTSRFFPLRLSIKNKNICFYIKFGNICLNCFSNMKHNILKCHSDCLPIKNKYCSLKEIKLIEKHYKCPDCFNHRLIVKNNMDYIELYCNKCKTEYHCRQDKKGNIIKCIKLYPQDLQKN